MEPGTHCYHSDMHSDRSVVPERGEYPPPNIDDCRILWLKVIERAVRDYRIGKSPGASAEMKEYYKDAERWLFSSEDDGLTFLSLCSILEVDSRKIRETLNGNDVLRGRQAIRSH